MLINQNIDDKIKVFKDQLILKNSMMNLIAESTIKDIDNRHIKDSLQLLNYIASNDIILTDLGTGAGFPGLILAFAGIKKVNLIESNRRKAEFLLESSKDLANVKIYNKRIEEIKYFKSDIITARALAPLNKLLNISIRFNHSNIQYLFLKGEKTLNEIDEAEQEFEFEYKLYPSLTNNKSFIVNIYNLYRKGKK